MITVSEFMPTLLCKCAALHDMDDIHGTQSAVRFFKISSTIFNDIIWFL